MAEAAAGTAADAQCHAEPQTMRDLEKEYCCCQVFEIAHGVYLIALHCVLQAAYAIGLVLTSYYKTEHRLIVYMTVASNFLLAPAGITAFWATLYESRKGARVAGFLMFFLGILNTVIGSVYFFWFCQFQANSQLDKTLFWTDSEDWVGSQDLPFTFWHFFTFEFILVNPLWLYYARVLCKLASLIKEDKK